MATDNPTHITDLRVCITGGPRCGKTTFSSQFRHVWHTDYLILAVGHDEWSAQSEEVYEWLKRPGPWVYEGVTVVRALRKWLSRHSTEKPCDIVYWLGSPRTMWTERHAHMMKGQLTIWEGIKFQLQQRGVWIIQP